MFDKYIAYFKDRTVWILAGICMAGSLIYAFCGTPFFLRLTDAVSICSLILLFAGVFRWSWKSADYAAFSWKPAKGPLSEYRKSLIEERKKYGNPMLPAGIILFVTALIFTFIY